MKKVAIITTHPIQYYAPIFKQLAGHCDLKVFYTWGETVKNENYDPDFKRVIKWDIPLLDGYAYSFALNSSKKPGSNHFMGIKNPNLKKNIQNFSPDIILVYGWAYFSHLKTLVHFKNKTTIWFRGDSNLLDEKPGIKKELRAIFLKWVFKHVDKALYVGKANKEYYKKFGLKQEQLVFVPHAIDNERFNHVEMDKAVEIRNNLGVKTNDILILFAGKFEDKKDPLILLKSFIKQQNPNLHLLFLGNGHLEDQLKEIASQHSQKYPNLSNNIHFLDFQNQLRMPLYYHASDILCLPSQGPGETWGLVVNEAMACKKAVIVSDKVGCYMDLVDSSNGYVFESGNELKLLDIILSLDKKKLGEKGLNSYLKIQNYSYEKAIKAIVQHL